MLADLQRMIPTFFSELSPAALAPWCGRRTHAEKKRANIASYGQPSQKTIGDEPEHILRKISFCSPRTFSSMASVLQ